MLIFDINMPVSGYELAEKVKEIRPAVKVWLLSGCAEREETKGYPLIRKPFTQADLARVMT